MEFRRNQEEMVGYNPQIRPSAFSKPLLPPTASLLGTPRNNGLGTTTSDVFNPIPVPTTDLHPPTTLAASVVIGVADAFTTTTVTPSLTVARSTFTVDSSTSAEAKAKYRECLRNHAASLGGYVLDGCGDFMPAGESDPLKCAACGCHRSFHRREVEGESSYFSRFGNGSTSHAGGRGGRVPLLPPPPPLHHHPPPPPPQQWLPRSPGAAAAAAAAAAAFGGNYSGSGGATTESSSEENPGALGTGPPAAAGSSARKRFRSKFTTEQKKRMLAFAESVGWRMQKQEEALVEQFCAEVGVRRQVLKVWMHNNKHTVRRQQHEHQQHQQTQHQQEHQQHQQTQHQHQQQHHQQEHQHQQTQHQQQHQQTQHQQQQQQHNQQHQLH